MSQMVAKAQALETYLSGAGGHEGEEEDGNDGGVHDDLFGCGCFVTDDRIGYDAE